MNNWPRSEASRTNVKFWGQSFKQGHYHWANIPASQKGVYLFYNPPINFRIVLEPLAKSQCWSEDEWARLMRASKFDRLNFISTVIRPKLDSLRCEMNSCNAPKNLALFSFLFCILLISSQFSTSDNVFLAFWLVSESWLFVIIRTGNSSINFRAISLAASRHVVDSDHAITPVRVDICRLPLISIKKGKFAEKKPAREFQFSSLSFYMEEKRPSFVQSSNSDIRKLVFSVVSEIE